MKFSHQTYCRRRLSLLLIIAVASSLASSTYGQRITPPPFALSPQGLQSFPPNQMPLAPPSRRMLARSIVKKTLTNAQLNQALIAEAYRRNSVHVSELLAQGANPNAAQRGGVTPLVMAVSLGNLEAVRHQYS